MPSISMTFGCVKPALCGFTHLPIIRNMRKNVFLRKKPLPPARGPQEKLLRSLSQTMSKDPVGEIAVTDPLVKELGLFRAGESTNETGKYKYARDRMRRIARIVLRLRADLKCDKNLHELLVPDNFANICEAARKEGQLETKTPTPHATKRIKEDVLKCLQIKESMSQTGSSSEQDAKKLRQPSPVEMRGRF